MDDYYFYLVSSKNPLYIFVGKMNFDKVEFCGLKIGDKVNRVGDSDRSGQASLNRLQIFKTFVTYVGTFKVNDIKTRTVTEFLIFELQDKEKPEGINESCYIGYKIIRDGDHVELIVPDLKHNNPVYVLRPKFGLVPQGLKVYEPLRVTGII